MGKDKLFSQFPPVTTEEWMEQINADLKGADFNRKLVWRTDGGLEVMPFYRKEDLANIPYVNSLPGEYPYMRGSSDGKSWHIRQDITVDDYAAANSKALGTLMKGVDSLGFIITDPGSVTPGSFSVLLKDISIEAVELNFLPNGKAAEILEELKKIVGGINYGYDKLKGAIEADPLGRLMVNGTLCIDPAEGFDYLYRLSWESLAFPYLKTIHLKASEIGNAGGDIVQELAFALSMGNEYLAQLTGRGLTLTEAASRIRFSFAAGSDYFPEIAKLRAARMLWSMVQKGYAGEGEGITKMEIHCTTGRWNKTIYDPFVNMLRTQTEAMSSVLGGADSLTVEPFDSVWKSPGEFSSRIARNQQLILKEEAHLDKVTDPAGGSYYIENLTSLISDKAWKLFVETEEQGGFLEALKKGFIQEKIAGSAKKKMNDAATRKTVILGTNQYPRSGEKAPEPVSAEKIFAKKVKSPDDLVDPLRVFRLSEEYEKIRMAVEKSGKVPSVFLLTIGNPAMRRARAQFSAGFFGCAGYTVTDNNGFSTADEAVAAALASKADIVVICSSDEEYAGLVPEISRLIGGNAIIVVAGNPACADDLKAAGIVNFIHLRSDVPGTLAGFNAMLGIDKL